MEESFEDTGLVDELTPKELITEGLLPKRRRIRQTRSEVRTIYKYPHAREFYDTLQCSHSVEEMHDVLVVGLEFPDLGLVKIDWTTHSIS